MTPLVKRQLLQALHPHNRSVSQAEKAKLLDAIEALRRLWEAAG